ncbi:MAG TPA: type II toxin-antitoxin system Phd/YefM family antitoxin [Leptospiraceae bacterium]|nr:type II toxin-antitoxin system Phd/YefM family antitoxin [Leptospiraceae bacterium]
MVWKIAAAKSQFSELVSQAEKEPQVVYNRKKPSVVVLSFEEYTRLHSLDVLIHRPPKWSEFTAFSEKLADEKCSTAIELPSRKDRNSSVF